MRYVLLLVLIITSTFAKADTLPFQAIFYDENSQIQYEGLDFEVQTDTGNEYLNYHNILETLRLNRYLYNPNFEIGVIDSGIYSNHEDFHNFYQGYLGGGQTSVPSTYHGSLVSSLFGFSEINNDLGIHGVVNAKVNFINRGKFSYLEVYKELLRQSSPKVVNISYTQYYCSSYRAYYVAAYDGIDQKILNKQPSVYRDCNLTKESVYNDTVKDQHIRNFQDIRTEILNNPETLFVTAAGNRGVDALWEEGALYYEVDDLGDISVNPVKLDNVLIVGDIDNEGILESYSNYGETVDIVAMGTAYGATTTSITDGIISSFYKENSGTSFSAPIVAGMASVLFSMDSSLTPKDVKELLLNSGKSTDTRHTGNLLTNRTESVFTTPIADLKVSYDVLKARLETEVQMDVAGLQGLTQLVSNENDCVLLWNNGTSSRKVIGSDKSYEAKFYGDRCLFYRGNSFIIDYDLETKTASKLYYNQYNSNRYREYMTFRHFVNNMKSAKTDETWRNGYGVTLNSYENVGCTTADNCANGEITTAQQCENLFVALTGVFPSVMNSITRIKGNEFCSFDDSDRKVQYNMVSGQILVISQKKEYQGSLLSVEGVTFSLYPSLMSQGNLLVEEVQVPIDGYEFEVRTNGQLNTSMKISVEYVNHAGLQIENGFAGQSTFTFTDINKSNVDISVSFDLSELNENDEIVIKLKERVSSGF